MIVTVMGQKGGVGKSTTAIALAMVAFERGANVLLVDADPQGTTRTWSEVATEHGRRTPSVVAMGAAMHRPGQLDVLARGYDWTFIDCPPRHGDVQRSALMVADVALLPCGPTAADAWAITSSVELVNEARVVRDSLLACIAITRKQGRTSLGKAARSVLEQAGLSVLGAELSYRVAYQEALAAGSSVTEYCRRDPAAREVRALFDELEKFAYAEKTSGCFPAQAAAG